jgi:hypothetical protein
MAETVALVDYAKSWMSRHGWHTVSEGRAGSMWVNPEFGEDNRIGLLRRLTDDSRDFQDLVERLSYVHNIPPKVLAQEVRHWAIDVTYLRAVNDFVIADSIPLSAGATMLESARMMFRSAATAAVKIRPSINGSYSLLGDRVSEQVRMGHTLRGSYVVPVLVNIGEPDDTPDEPEGSFFEDGAAAPKVESLERRATRTFAQALNAVFQHLVTPESMPRGSQVQTLVTNGVTREFASAVSAVLSEPAVSELGAQFEWAPSHGSPAGTPKRVEIPSAAQPKIQAAVGLLRAAKVPKQETLTGPIVVIAKEPEDEQTRFGIRTVRGGRQCRVETFTAAPLAEVTEWMNNGTIVQITGDVVRLGNTLSVPRPVSVAAITELAHGYGGGDEMPVV